MLSSILELAINAPSQVQKGFYEDQMQSFRDFETLKWTTPSTQSCIVCGEEKYPFEFPQMITQRCDHSPHICDEDLMGWVASELRSKTWDRIKCPECTELLHNEDMKTHASAETFERWVLLPLTKRKATASLL